jgi:hypothetical protein
MLCVTIPDAGASWSIPGVGALAALAFKTSVDVPQRFAKSKSVGAAHYDI